MNQYLFLPFAICFGIAFLEIFLLQRWNKFFLDSGIFVTSKRIDTPNLDLEKIRAKASRSQYSMIEFKEIRGEVYFRTNFKEYFNSNGSVFLKLTTGKIVYDRRSKGNVLKVRFVWLPVLALLFSLIVNLQAGKGQFFETTGLMSIIGIVWFFISRIFYKRYVEGLLLLLNES